ncbi:hypothetical protein [Pseudomonas coronafaciens]|uniref:hypothetical protein n=1 Tax=Pseudomonas coronafaciens TaxID=53409 RepID=UPI001F2718A9|nr:hypothetical protein [Pseudomonas coronafaciens]
MGEQQNIFSFVIICLRRLCSKPASNDEGTGQCNRLGSVDACPEVVNAVCLSFVSGFGDASFQDCQQHAVVTGGHLSQRYPYCAFRSQALDLVGEKLTASGLAIGQCSRPVICKLLAVAFFQLLPDMSVEGKDRRPTQWFDDQGLCADRGRRVDALYFVVVPAQLAGEMLDQAGDQRSAVHIVIGVRR